MEELVKGSVLKEFYTEEKCYIKEILNSPTQRDFSIAQARVEPGITTALHKLKATVEYYYITEGEGEAEINGQLIKVSKGDLLKIESDLPQRIKNTGTLDLIFLCLCFPAFETKSYVDLENDH